MEIITNINTLKPWLVENITKIVSHVIGEMPTCSIDEHQITRLYKQTIFIANQEYEIQQMALKKWMSRHVELYPFVDQWTAIICQLKEATFQALRSSHPAEIVLDEWPGLDRVFTMALIECGQLANHAPATEIAKQIIHLGDQLAALEENKTRFIKVAAHELKTPLTLLEGYANMLRQTVSEDNTLAQMYIGGFDGGTERLRRIIDDMIEMSTIVSGKMEIKKQPVNIAGLLEKAVREVKRSALQREVDIVFEPITSNDFVLGDPDKLVKAFAKIINNGMKFTPDGGQVMIKPHIFKLSSPSGYIKGHVIVEVTDTGIGIDPDNLNKIFQIFGGTNNIEYHSSGTSKFMGYGPGLGLPIAKGIIDAHGGKIMASSPGLDEDNCPGSTFTIKLPLYHGVQK
ncbi:MAG: HAMP domain-containing sensor histidine kinase [Chloroflexota bacterium]